MKVIVAAPFGKGQKDSYEYYNFYLPLEKMVESVIGFDYLDMQRKLGRENMNQALLELVRSEQPTFVFFVPQTDQFIPEVIDEINRHTITLAYFFDDMWRVEYSRFWAKHFTYVTSSDVNGIRKFKNDGYTNVVYSPFSCNTQFFTRKNLPKKYDVSFVGQFHPVRAWYLQKLRESGFDVHAWGPGWEAGPLDYAGMVDVFNQSRINLNLSNSVSWDLRYLMTLKRPVKYTLRAWREIIAALVKPDKKVREQVKGRHFEINACGGFQISYYVEGLERHYKIGEEIALYESVDELVDKISYYLKHNDEREAIAQMGYERTLHDHTMEYRIQQIFEQIENMRDSGYADKIEKATL